MYVIGYVGDLYKVQALALRSKASSSLPQLQDGAGTTEHRLRYQTSAESAAGHRHAANAAAS